MVVLVRRFADESWRNPAVFWSETASVLVTSVVVGLLFLNVRYDSAAAVQNRVVAISTILVQTTRYVAIVGAREWVRRRALLQKEAALGLYAKWQAAVTGLAVQVPFILPPFILAIIIFYFMSSLPADADVFFFFMFISCAYVVLISVVGGLTAAFFTLAVLPALLFYVTVNSMLGGISLPGNQIPQWLLGLYYLFPLHYANEALVTTVLNGNMEVFCNPLGGNVTVFSPSAVGVGAGLGVRPPPPCPFAGSTTWYLPDAKVWACCALPLTRPITVSAFALTGMTYSDGLTFSPTWGGPPNGFQYANRGMDIGVLLAFTVALAACFVAAMQWVNHRGPRG